MVLSLQKIDDDDDDDNAATSECLSLVILI